MAKKEFEQLTRCEKNGSRSAWSGEDNGTLWTVLSMCVVGGLMFGLNAPRAAYVFQQVVCFATAVVCAMIVCGCGRELLRRYVKRLNK